MEVTIYKTSVEDEIVAQHLVVQLQIIIPDFKINFDLEDCDNILRLCGNRNVSQLVINHMQAKGFECTEIE